jgi:serine/threonine protein kinase
MAWLHAQAPPLLHRDLKSLNVLLDDQWRAKVLNTSQAHLSKNAC